MIPDTGAVAARSSHTQPAAKMGQMETTHKGAAAMINTSPTTPAPRQLEAEEYAHIAEAVALTLKPMIKETVEAAMNKGLEQKSRVTSTNKSSGGCKAEDIPERGWHTDESGINQ